MPTRTANRCLRAAKSKSANAINKGTVRHRSMRISGDDDGGATIDGIVVDTVAVAVTGVVPSVDVTLAGTTVHVAADGAPVQPRVTAWLKPPAGVTVTVKVPLAPCATVNVVGAALRLKLADAVPVPLNITV